MRCSARHFKDEDLKALQELIGTPLPPDVVAHYREVNGGIVGEECAFRVNGHNYSVQDFYPIGKADMGPTLEQCYEGAAIEQATYPRWMLPLANVIAQDSDDEGSYCLAVSVHPSSKGGVYLVEESCDPIKATRVAKNLSVFIHSLVPLPE